MENEGFETIVVLWGASSTGMALYFDQNYFTVC